MSLPTCCPRGHEYTLENTKWKQPKDRPNPSRYCRTCHNGGRPRKVVVVERRAQPEDVQGDELQRWLAVRDYEVRMRLPDHECVHGKLPGDRDVQCDCWEVSDGATGGLQGEPDCVGVTSHC